MTDRSNEPIQETDFEQGAHVLEQIRRGIARVIVGQDEVTEQILWCVFGGGHALLEGIPGLGKTVFVRTAAEVLNLQFSRIQFTPDLMPADITGTDIVLFGERGETSYRFRPGPIFGNLVLADEINRATPKTQSALLEAMQEQTVTIGTNTHRLPQPFFVLATQNPLESEGTYPLPEAQLDRFMLKIKIGMPDREQLKQIVRQTTAPQLEQAGPVCDGEEVSRIQRLIRHILLADDVLEEAVQIVLLTHPEQADAPPSVKERVRYGSGPRGAQSLIAAAKVRAFTEGRLHVSVSDLQAVAIPALRHRVWLNFEAEAEGVSVDDILQELIDYREQNR